MIWDLLGIEEPGNDFVLLDNNEALGMSGILYAAWACGEPTAYENADGDTVDLYDAQIYLLVQGCEDEDAASATVEDWAELASQRYEITDSTHFTSNGQDFSVLRYQTSGEANPYSDGVTAYTTFGCYAINVELTCGSDYAGDRLSVLSAFVDGIHYSEFYQ